MKEFLNSKGNIVAFELDGSQDHLITDDMAPINRALNESGNYYSKYLSEPDDNGTYQPDTDFINKQLIENKDLLIQAAYSNPITGSDKFLLEALKKEAMGDIEGANNARAIGIARAREIKKSFST